MAKQKKKLSSDSTITKIWIGLIIFITISFAVFAFRISETGGNFFNSNIWNYTRNSLITLLLIFLILYKKAPLYINIFLLGYVAMVWIYTFLFSIRIEILLNYLWAISAAISSIVAFIKMDDKIKRKLCRFDIIIFLVLLSTLQFFIYIKHIDNNAFLLPSVIIGTFAFIITILLVIKFQYKVLEKQNLIWIPLVSLMFATVFTYLTLTATNFCLDFSQPTIKSAEIIKKDIITGVRRPTTFDLYIMIDGKKVNISVPSNVYHNFEQGDYINIFIYKGFWEQPYYFYDNILVK